MYLQNLRLKNFRNYSDEEITFSDGLNIVIGNNAQGKTNMLEAIFFCSIGKSLRASKEREVIGFSGDIAKIILNVKKKYQKTQIDLSLAKKDKKIVKINSIPIKRIGELMGELTCIYFSPDELKLIKESPQDRRRFMDIDISQTSKNYFYLLSRYDKILASRNRILKSNSELINIKDMISIYDEQLSDIGSKIIKSRINFLTKLTPYAEKCHSFLTSKKESLSLEYAGITGDSSLVIKQIMLDQLKKNIDKDFSLGFTTVGPHRDDIKVLVNGIDIRTYGSQGQQRTTALSMKLAELGIIKDEIGESPILLLDDVFSELDYARRKKLIKFAEKTQTIITCTDFEFNNIPHQKIIVKDGKVSVKISQPI